jgi:transposase
LPILIEDARLPDPVRAMLLEVRERLAVVNLRLARCDQHIATHARRSDVARRARDLFGVGPVTSSALAATVPDAKIFRNGRQFGAWLGLTPRQHSFGGRTRLGHMSLQGTVYLRTLLVQGARSTLQSALRADPTHASRLQRWIRQLHERMGYHKTLIAIANKHARMLWAILARDERYEPMSGNAIPCNRRYRPLPPDLISA